MRHFAMLSMVWYNYRNQKKRFRWAYNTNVAMLMDDRLIGGANAVYIKQSVGLKTTKARDFICLLCAYRLLNRTNIMEDMTGKHTWVYVVKSCDNVVWYKLKLCHMISPHTSSSTDILYIPIYYQQWTPSD